ncbi:hypothetical protein LZ31DRAFT_316308 [Colletotrichum somersetense]|nr:hypothetical protein LZ31DRAFT_316308 [Colletotrichum somersetense]
MQTCHSIGSLTVEPCRYVLLDLFVHMLGGRLGEEVLYTRLDWTVNGWIAPPASRSQLLESGRRGLEPEAITGIGRRVGCGMTKLLLCPPALANWPTNNSYRTAVHSSLGLPMSKVVDRVREGIGSRRSLFNHNELNRDQPAPTGIFQWRQVFFPLNPGRTRRRGGGKKRESPPNFKYMGFLFSFIFILVLRATSM